MSEENRDFTTFIGVDLGGGKGKNTAVACLERTAEGVRVVHVSTRDQTGGPYHDGALVSYIRQHRRGALLAMDAPLTLSVCVRCRLPRCPSLGQCVDPVVRWFRHTGDPLVRGQSRPGRKPPTTAYTQRACEVLMHRQYGVMPREALGQGMGPLTARAHYLRRVLEDQFALNEDLIEVYPKATIHVIFGEELARKYKRGVDTWRQRAEILEELGNELKFEVWRQGCLENDHCFDAVICAYTGYLWAKQNWTMPEEHREVYEQDGWIWFPRGQER